MGHAKMLRNLFKGVILNVEDLLFLESFQVAYLPDRVPKQEFAVLLSANPIIHRYLVAACPSVSNFINGILKDNADITNNKTVDENCSDLLWEIADLIIYSKYPEIYDANVEFVWDNDEIIPVKYLKNKVVIDAGAGPGKLAFTVAQFAETVFAVEPIQGFRQFIREKASRENVKNLFVVDGFLDLIPFPDNSIDILMTSNAIGWNLERELKEIERVLKQNGKAIHLLRSTDAEAENSLHDFLVSQEWKYKYTKYKSTNGLKLKYSKTMRL